MITIHKAVRIAFETSDPGLWQSIVINRRRPHTWRAFLQHGDSRICLHRFTPCDAAESFAHPHPWPSSMLVLAGVYDMNVGLSRDPACDNPAPVIQVTLNAGSVYHMTERLTWHQVVPRTECFSLMVNGPRWSDAHHRAPATGGKGLQSMTAAALTEHLAWCRKLLEPFLNGKV